MARYLGFSATASALRLRMPVPVPTANNNHQAAPINYLIHKASPKLLPMTAVVLLLVTAPSPAQDRAIEATLAASEEAADAGRLSAAEALAREAIAAAHAEGSLRLAADAQRRLGQVLIDLNRSPEAGTALRQSLATLEPLGQSESLGRTLASMALVHRY